MGPTRLWEREYMQSLTSIVAVNAEGVIGSKNALPWRLRTDMRFFREQTTGNVVLMGRKTFDSLGRKCLPNRTNVVISHNFGLFPETDSCRAAYGIEDALFRAAWVLKPGQHTFVIGGASMYAQFAEYADRYLITLVEKAVAEGDTFFDQNFLGDPDEWNIRKLRDVEAGAEDEAPFSLFEVRSLHPEVFQERRRAAIERARSAATAGLQSKPRSRRKSSGNSTERSYSML
jgi:dihydrofolate reductase